MIPEEFPPTHVLDAFGLRGDPEKLAGGQGNSYLVGSFILKREQHEALAQGTAEIVSDLVVDGLRIPQPLRSTSSRMVEDGWTAYRRVSGKEQKGRFEEKLEISTRLHNALAQIQKPAFLDGRTHPWAIADAFVWDGRPLEMEDRIKTLVGTLQSHIHPIDVESQLIHGDLSGNILFAEDESPAIIDFSLYWRPSWYANAIILTDVVVWEDHPLTTIESFLSNETYRQLLLRAALWRIVTIQEFEKVYGIKTSSPSSYLPLVELLTA